MKKASALDYIIITYFKNILINIPYSVLMFGAIVLKLFAFENRWFSLLILSEIITAFLCAGYVLLILRERLAKILKLMSAVVIFALFLIGTDFLLDALGVRGKMGVIATLLFFSVQYFLSSSVIVMSFRHTLTEQKENIFCVILRNFPRLLITLFSSWAVFFILILHCVLFVNNRSGKYGDVFVPDRITEKWEPRLVLADIAIFIPVCNLAFLALHMWMFPEKE